MTLTARLLTLLLVLSPASLGPVPAFAVAADRDGGDCADAPVQVQPLAKIINTRDDNYQCLGVSVDARAEITAVRFETHEFDRDAESREPVERRVRVREFTPDEIARASGVVLDGRPGHDAVILQGDIVAGRSSAALNLRFLHNGLTSEFRQCAVKLDHAHGAAWRLVDSRNRAVPLVVVKTWALPLFGTIGIDTLQGICP